MDNNKRYNLFVLISTLARNITEVFSSVLLYKMGYSIRDILIFFCILYFIGSIVCSITLFLLGKVNVKYLLIISSIIFSISFYYMSIMNKTVINLTIFSVLFSASSYSYHSIRHYLAIKLVNKNKRNNVGYIIIYMNIAVIISSLISGYVESITSTVALSIIVVIISIISIIPIIRLDITEEDNRIINNKINKRKQIFFIFEQGKTIFLSLEPIYIYLFIEESIRYVGIISSIIGVASCIFTYFFAKKVDDKKYFKYFNLFFCFVLILKLNIFDKYIMLIIVFMEGLLIKMYDVVSMNNLYDIKKDTNIKGYLIKCEIIFCFVRGILCLIFIFIGDIKIMMYILIGFIAISGIVKR